FHATKPRAFTDGIKDPDNGRVQENEWRKTMLNLRDSIIYCPHCGEQNFYDINALKKQGKLNPCWNCQKEIVTPPRIRIGKKIIMLNHDTKLFPHHVDDGEKYDFSEAVAGVVRNPKNPNLWGLKNLSTAKWVVTTADNNMKDVEPVRSVTMAVGTKINFGTEKGEIRV
ncbi:MAG: serine/threonine protein kinase, partial [Okeania sp. SIO2D1]|nr:serine/threonine protein kinase [Okeania sp. SIO2D1]